MTSADDVAVMTSPRADVSKRNLARDSAWMRVGARDGAWRHVKDPGNAWRCVERVSSCAEFSGGA